MSEHLRIGVAACFFHADPARPIFKGKTLLYLEESLSHWLMGGGAVPYLLPTPAAGVEVLDLLAPLDGLVLQGGSDVSPTSYGETPLRPEWKGDEVRDRYEAGLIDAAMALDRPILGVCRGLQMLNVAFGGTLYQDIATQHEGAQVHRDWDRYDQVQHDITIEPGSWLSGLRTGSTARVNSVHHQGVKQLARGLRVEARSIPDGMVEAVRYEPEGAAPDTPFVYAVQWHPEFQDPADRALLETEPLRDMFLEAAEARRNRRPTGAPRAESR